MEVSVYGFGGEKSGSVALDPSVFGVEASGSIYHSVVRWQRAKARAGTHATLTRTKMEGGGKKPWKQKGTGRARAGSATSPLWVGGAVSHGPQPRSYEFKLPRKVKRQALLGALSSRRAQEGLVVVDEFKLDRPSTRSMKDLLARVGLPAGTKVLFLYSSDEQLACMSARNIAGVSCLRVDGVNVYDLLNHSHVLISKGTLEALQQRLQGE